ncbi:MAG: hypothetical protein H8K08_04520 [Nitrospira sp.]|jgi:hypothetical protein|nr:hypothetical protein [Nitrospira sp.]
MALTRFCGNGDAIVLLIDRLDRARWCRRLKSPLIRSNHIMNLMDFNSHVSLPGAIG